ncbi:MAG: hypothetical protein CMJ25_01215 [Phycisphaerae bacterium]|nr:hypothetical protein [Phycisphaerae bacterium]|tara:strand:- start:437 stop:907 length:471 start_codon:yes stop_codon:yes gene_type:complete
MSQQGSRAFYNVTETIKAQLLADINVNTVTTGDITEVDLQKQTIFPLSHIMVNNVSQEDGVLRFNVSIMSMDIVDQSKEITVDIFEGNNNLQDILNTQLSVLNKLTQILRGGTLHFDKYQLDGNPNIEPFYDRFENELAGWTASMDILIYNDISIC